MGEGVCVRERGGNGNVYKRDRVGDGESVRV